MDYFYCKPNGLVDVFVLEYIFSEHQASFFLEHFWYKNQPECTSSKLLLGTGVVMTQVSGSTEIRLKSDSSLTRVSVLTQVRLKSQSCVTGYISAWYLYKLCGFDWFHSEAQCVLYLEVI